MTRPLTARRTLAAAALAPLLLTGLVACGDDDSGSQAKDSTSAAAALTGLQKGEEVDPGEFVDTIADGVEASTTAHMTMTMSLGSMGEMSGEGDLDYTVDPPEIAMTMDLPMDLPMAAGTKTEMRLVDGVFYLSLGGMSGGKFWKLDPSDPDSPLADFGDMADQLDPMGTLQKLEPALDAVTYAGDEDVDGQSLDHYELTVDPGELATTMELPAEAKAQLPDTITYDIWLDDEDRLSKMKMDLPVAGMDSSIEITASDWGKEVTIEAPPADEITEMPELGSMMPGGTVAG